MSDMHVQLEKQRVEAANSAPIGKLATEAVKRELFAKLAQLYNVLAAEVQKAIVRLARPGLITPTITVCASWASLSRPSAFGHRIT